MIPHADGLQETITFPDYYCIVQCTGVIILSRHILRHHSLLMDRWKHAQVKYVCHERAKSLLFLDMVSKALDGTKKEDLIQAIKRGTCFSKPGNEAICLEETLSGAPDLHCLWLATPLNFRCRLASMISSQAGFLSPPFILRSPRPAVCSAHGQGSASSMPENGCLTNTS